MKNLKSLLILLGLVSCSTPPTTPTTPGPIGTWTYTETFDNNGVPSMIEAVLNVFEGNTYSIVGLWTDGSNTITIATEAGIWSLNGAQFTCIPSTCKQYDFTTSALTPIECSKNTVYVINGDTMTDGTNTLTKE